MARPRLRARAWAAPALSGRGPVPDRTGAVADGAALARAGNRHAAKVAPPGKSPHPRNGATRLRRPSGLRTARGTPRGRARGRSPDPSRRAMAGDAPVPARRGWGRGRARAPPGGRASRPRAEAAAGPPPPHPRPPCLGWHPRRRGRAATARARRGHWCLATMPARARAAADRRR
jgi:hypothetical protein